MAAIEEVTVEQFTEGPRDDPKTILRTKIKLRSASAAIQAAELLGKYLGLWNDKGPVDAALTGKTVVEVVWQGSPQETQQEPNGPRALSQQPTSGVVLENLGVPNIAAQRIDETAAGDIYHLEDRGRACRPISKTQPAVNGTSRL
jgi:hypothetical protein